MNLLQYNNYGVIYEWIASRQGYASRSRVSVRLGMGRRVTSFLAMTGGAIHDDGAGNGSPRYAGR
jgi:hypothetical protein